MSKIEEIQVGDEVVEAVAQKTDAKIDEKIEAIKSSIVVPTADEIADAMIAKSEKVEKKDVHEGTEKADRRHLDKGMGSLSKEMRFAKALAGERIGDVNAVKEYNQYSLKQWSEKANYQNVTTAADGGAIVPDPEFMAEVDRLTQEYGVAARLANIRTTDRDSVTILAGTNEVSFTRTGEATPQNAQKLTYSASTVSLDKYILTLVMTSELVEDAAINIFQDATTEIARARAKLFDQLVFTDSTYGLLYAPDSGEAWKTQTVGSAITDFTADDAMNAQYQVVTSARRNARYFMHPTVWNSLRQTKSGDGTNSAANYLFGGPGQAVTPNIDGIPVELVDILPAKGEITANEPFAVYGDLGRVMIHVKRLLETKTFDAGVVKDAGGSDFNLITQDAFAIRATLRAVPQTKFPDAFCIIGTGTVS